MICDYEGCLYKTSEEHKSADPTKCVFHAAPRKKGVDDSVFINLLARHIGRKHFDFSGFVFHVYIDFKPFFPKLNNQGINEEVKFIDCKFLGGKELSIKIEDEVGSIYSDKLFAVSFENMEFDSNIQMINCEFKHTANFRRMRFKSFFNLVDSEFQSDCHFENAQFLNANAEFDCNSEQGKGIDFRGNVFFNGLKFEGEKREFVFRATRFHRNVTFRNSKIKALTFVMQDIVFKGQHTDFKNINIESPTIIFTDLDFSSNINNFKGAKFSGRMISFEKSSFYSSTTFEDAIFNKTDDLSQSINSFRNVNFKGSEVSFWKTTFNCNMADFENTIINCNTRFEETKFLDGVSFKKTKFTNFSYIRDEKYRLIKEELQNYSKKVEILFSKVQFDGDVIDFTEAEFSCDKIEMNNVNINSELSFISNKIYDNSIINFNNLYLTDNKRFIFRSPEFVILNIVNTIFPVIYFENINFNPIKSTFENILDMKTNKFTGKNGKDYRTPTFVIIFRYCYLKDVYFISTSTSNISFYKSFFDEAIFISSHWNYEIDKLFKIIPYQRKNIIFEDYLLNGELALGFDFKELIQDRVAKDEHFKKYKIEDLNGNDEIASLYRRLKTALDRTKDYIQAGWFYYNEYEMLRLYNKQGKGKFSKWKYYLYSIYKYFAGYGEKPFWSFIWFIIFTIILSSLNFINGFKFRGGEINYDIILNSDKGYTIYFWIWIMDFVKAIFFTLSRVLPTSYIPIEKSDFGTLDSLGLALGVVSAFILIFFITMIFSGLKRHFRRF